MSELLGGENKFTITAGSTGTVIPMPPRNGHDRAPVVLLKTATPSNCERALALADLGLSVFPCLAQAEPDKIDPETGEVVKGKKAKSPYPFNGFHAGTADRNAIRSWWRQWPDALVGLCTGKENGIAVADLDAKGESDWRLSLPKVDLDLPDTHTVTTRSGGLHKYYRYPAGVEKITSGQNLFKHLAGNKKTGIDIRGDGGYVVAWADLTAEIIGGLAEWPTEGFADAFRREEEAGRDRHERGHQPRQENTQPDDLERARAALEFVPADDRDDWVKVGMALKAAFGESGRPAWDAWSGTSDSFDRRDQEEVWRSFKRDGVELGTLFHLAKQNGYRPTANRLPAVPKGSPAIPGEAEGGIEGMLSDGTLKKMFVARHRNDLRFVATQGKWYCYDAKRWRIDNKREHLENAWRLCREVAQQCVASGRDSLVKFARTIDSIKTVKAVLELSSADPEIAVTVDQWDADPWQLNTPGGIVDLRTGETHPHRAEDYVSKTTLVSPDPEMKTPVWDSFLDYTMCGDKEVIAYTQRVLGYCLTGSIREHALFFGWGPGGNGKGTLVNTAAKSMGDYAQIAPIDTFTASKNSRHETELARMQGARLITASETEEGKRWDEAKIKWLTGGDKIAARFMRGDYFEFNPQHKLLIVGNHKPGIRTADEAIRRRFHLIPFNATVPKEKRDKLLDEKLVAELPGILAWLIKGCLAWQKIGLSTPASIVDATDEYLTGEDNFEAWFKDCAERDHKSLEPLQLAYASWKAWCDENGEYVESNRAFRKRLENKGFKTQKATRGRVVHGMHLKVVEKCSLLTGSMTIMTEMTILP